MNQQAKDAYLWWLALAMIVAAALVALLGCGAAHAMAIESVERASSPAASHHVFIAPYAGSQPAQGASFMNSAGLTITRVSDVVTAGGYPNYPKGYDGLHSSGLTNGYSHYSCANRTGEYVLAFGTTPMSVLYRLSDFKCLGAVRAAGGAYLGDGAEPRWGRRADEPATMLYYHVGRSLLRQDVLRGPTSEETIYILPDTILQTDDNELTNDGRYGICKLANGTGVVFDYFAKNPLPGTIPGATSGLDLSPDGMYATRYGATKTGPTYYAISDLAAGDSGKGYVRPDPGGHGGWGYGYDGRCRALYQCNSDDWIKALDPGTHETWKLMYMGECGFHMNQHMGRVSNPAKRGWALISTYSTNDNNWSYNQLFMLEIKPLVKPDNSTVPLADRPRIWRLGHTQGNYGPGDKDYFNEDFASIDIAGLFIYWGNNWRGADNLELYRMTLPAAWHEWLSGSDPTPAPEIKTITIEPLSTQMITHLKDGTGEQAGDGYEMFCKPMTPSATLAVQSMLVQVDLSVIPIGAEIISADMMLTKHPKTEYGFVTKGHEGIAARELLIDKPYTKIWRKPGVTSNEVPTAASYKYMIRDGLSLLRWSDKPSTSTNSFDKWAGNVLTVAAPITQETERFNFSVTGTTSSLSIKRLAQGSVGRLLQFILDSSTATSTDQFPKNGSTKLQYNIRGAFYGEGASDPALRPKIKIRYLAKP